MGRHGNKGRKAKLRLLRPIVFARDNYTCVYCGAKPDRWLLEMDHVVPRSRGGSDDQSNLVTACQSCNGSKWAWLPSEWAGPKSAGEHR